jgi:hypothetical protein
MGSHHDGYFLQLHLENSKPIELRFVYRPTVEDAVKAIDSHFGDPDWPPAKECKKAVKKFGIPKVSTWADPWTVHKYKLQTVSIKLQTFRLHRNEKKFPVYARRLLVDCAL